MGGAFPIYGTPRPSAVSRVNRGTSYFRGINLGAAPGANVANVFFTTPPTLIGGGGTPGPRVGVGPERFGNASASGPGVVEPWSGRMVMV